MMEVLASLPAFPEALAFGCLSGVSTLAGSVLRAGLSRTSRRLGNCFCVFGLALMTIGFLCVTANMSFTAYAQRG